MLRCAPSLAAAWPAALSCFFLMQPTESDAQTRRFPATALRGELVVVQPPDVLLNRRPARLAPGARIRGADNLMQMSGALIGQPLLVHYTLDPQGLLLDVWLLSSTEAARRPWPSTPAQAARWSFDPASQTWVAP